MFHCPKIKFALQQFTDKKFVKPFDLIRFENSFVALMSSGFSQMLVGNNKWCEVHYFNLTNVKLCNAMLRYNNSILFETEE
jgi:hypothetical protein